METRYPELFKPFKIGKVEIKNNAHPKPQCESWQGSQFQYSSVGEVNL